jgi:hypothetical protein
MTVFGRRRGSEEPKVDLVEDDLAGDHVDGDVDGGAGDDEPAAPGPTTGPWDLEDLPASDELERLDFGGLRVWVPVGLDLRVDFGEQGELVALTLAAPDPSGDVNAMQVSAFAAPRRAGIWAEVRAEIAEGIVSSGGRCEETVGPWGPELHARLATDQPGVLAPARFLGVDGPRWFFRALLTGPAAASGTDHPGLDAALRQVVVVRGREAMAPRDAIALIPPPELAEQMTAAVQAAQGQQVQQDQA